MIKIFRLFVGVLFIVVVAWFMWSCLDLIFDANETIEKYEEQAPQSLENRGYEILGQLVFQSGRVRIIKKDNKVFLLKPKYRRGTKDVEEQMLELRGRQINMDNFSERF